MPFWLHSLTCCPDGWECVNSLRNPTENIAAWLGQFWSAFIPAGAIGNTGDVSAIGIQMLCYLVSLGGRCRTNMVGSSVIPILHL